jgi:uncharacterized protein
LYPDDKNASRKFGILYLLLTDQCNLACNYCFIENCVVRENNPQKFSVMSVGTAKYGIDLFARQLQIGHDVTEPQIILYGGEPLLNTPTLVYALQYITKCKTTGILPSDTLIILNTNGTLVSQDLVQILKAIPNLNVALSVDGPREIHDSCRRYHNGKGSFSDVIRGYDLLRRNGINVGLCCTISKYNVDRLEEIAHWFVDKLGVKSLGFNILIENANINDVRGDIEGYARKATSQLIKCFRFFRERGVYEDRVMRKVNAFIDGKVYYYDCGGCGQQIVVGPTGLVGVCQAYCRSQKNFVNPKEIKDFDPINHPLWSEWRRRSPLLMPQCRSCIALSVCGGGCPYSADMRHGSIWEVDDAFCIHSKETVTFLIQDLVRNV